MNSNGFGFSFNFGGNDDDNNGDNNQNNPFGQGAGGLGDMLNQFGQMISGMGSSMNSPQNQGAINYEMTERVANQKIGTPAPISQSDTDAVREASRLVELWLDEATYLPASGNTVEAWNEKDWFQNTLPMWKRLLTPVAEAMDEAQFQNLPEEAQEMVGAARNVMGPMSAMNLGVQTGNALGDLAAQTLSGSDFGLPLSGTGITALLPKNLERISADLTVPTSEVMVYLAAREAARQRLIRHVPWLVERIVSSVEEYAAGLSIDTSHIDEAVRELNIEENNPEQLQEAIQFLQNSDLAPRVLSSNANAAARLETLIALVEGWVDFVVTEALSERFPSTAAMNEAWDRRRATGGSAAKVFSTVVGIEIEAPRVKEARELWRRATVAVGIEGRDKVWDHPDFLPVASDLDNSAAFIDGLLDNSEISDFDPIAEITALEETLAQQSEQEAQESTEEDPEGKTDKKSQDED